MNVNPMQLIKLIKNGNNPQQLLQSVLQQQSGNNAILKNALELNQNGNISGLQLLARNLAQQRGLDFNSAFANFQKMLS